MTKSKLKISEIPMPNYYPDSIEISKLGIKLKVAFNIDYPDNARDRIDEALGMRDYATNQFLKSIEKLNIDNKVKK
jgi:hypothetical protein